MCPTVFWEDSGEFITVSWVLGISHPTGFPLYHVLGKLFQLVPLSNIAFRLNLLSSVAASIAAIFLFQWLSLRLNTRYIPFMATLFFVFTPLVWVNAATTEVYTTHLLILFGIMLSLDKGIFLRDTRYIYLTLFLLGLGTAVHITTILFMAPIVTILLFNVPGIFSRKWILLLFLIAGSCVYLGLPIRAYQNPLINWGNPSTWTTFFNHLTAKQYQHIMGITLSASMGSQAVARIKYLAFFLSSQYGIYLPITVLVGISILLKKNRQFLLFILSLGFLDIFYCLAINFEGFQDNQSGFILCTVYIILASTGLGGITQFTWISAKTRFVQWIIGLTILLVPLSMAIKHSKIANKKNHRSAYTWGMFILERLPYSSTTFLKQSDTLSIWMYMHLVEKYRGDLYFYSRNQLPFPGYLENMMAHFPGSAEQETLLTLIKTYRPRLHGQFEQYLLGSLKKRQGAYFWELGGEQPGMYKWLTQHGLLFQIKNKDMSSLPTTRGKTNLVKVSSWLETDLTWKQDLKAKLNIRTCLYNRALYYLHGQDFSKAIFWNRYTIKLFPDHVPSMNNLAVAMATTGKYVEALKWCKKAININPKHVNSYKNAALIYNLIGDKKSCRYYLEKALSLDPRDQQVYQTLNELNRY